MGKDYRHQEYNAFETKFTEIVGHHFSDKNLIITALTHRSLSDDNSERLEFLGDRVLALYVTDMLFKSFPTDSEGDLSKRLSYLVSRQALSEVAESIGLSEFIFIGHQDKLRHQMKILADIFEAVVGALYLDGGGDAARSFIHRHFSAKAEAYIYVPKDVKSALQEWSMKETKELPIYELLEQSGPAHAPHFIIKVSVQALGEAIGEGKSRKIAETEAAEKLYKMARHD